MGFGMRGRRGGRRRGGIRARRAKRRRRFGRRRGGRGGGINLLLCCFPSAQVVSVGANGEIHQSVADMIQQQGYLMQERQTIGQLVQSPNPQDKRQAEATRRAEHERFTALAENQKATYDEIVAMESTPLDPETARILAEDKAAILRQVQELMSMGYRYIEGAPGQAPDTTIHKNLGGVCVFCTQALLDTQIRCQQCPWLSLCMDCQSRGIHNEHSATLRQTDKTCAELAQMSPDQLSTMFM